MGLKDLFRGRAADPAPPVQPAAAPAGGGVRMHGASHPGKERSNNEDAFRIAAQLGLCIVADGMGGLARGEVASAKVVDTVIEAASGGAELPECFARAHDAVRAITPEDPKERMGATAVALRCTGPVARIAWVGDSRAYLWRGGTLKQLTKDHSLVQELVDVGAITAAEAETHPHRNVITRALGLRDLAQVEPATLELPLERGDRLLLCSDGLYGYLPEAAMVEALGGGGSEEQVVADLIQRTLGTTEAGDNLTAVLVSYT